MKTNTLSLSDMAIKLATGLVFGAALLFFSATQSRSQDYIYGDTSDQTNYELELRDNRSFGRTIITRPAYRYHRPYRYYHPRNRLYWGHGPGYVFQHFGLGPRYYPRGYHSFYDPFYHPYGYGYGGVGFSVRVR